MNISNYHTHTYLCNHAGGKPIDYVNQAIKDGCRSFGFSDHSPYPNDSVWEDGRMAVSEIPVYIKEIEEAKAAAPFPVFWGFESEWYPDYKNWYKDFLKEEVGAQYLIYGSHWIKDSGNFRYILEVSSLINLIEYTRLTIEGLATGIYDLFAHPDLFLGGFTSMTKNVKSACIDIIDAAVGMEIPMEINGNGLIRPKILTESGFRAPYPVREFWEIAADKNAIITYNSDAHNPLDAIHPCVKAIEFAEEIGISVVDPGVALGLID